MSSSDVGRRMLKKWHTERTLLTFVSLALSDALFPVEVRVGPVAPTNDRLVLTLDETGETLTLDLRKAKFRLADADKEPPPVKAWVGRFVSFLFLQLKDKRLYVFGEKIPTA